MAARRCCSPRGHRPPPARPGTPSGPRAGRGARRPGPDVRRHRGRPRGPRLREPPRTAVAGVAERWATIRSVSKSIGPDLRLAVLAGDEVTVSRVEGRQALGTGWVSGLLQEIVAELWADRTIDRLFARAAAAYAQRRGHLIDALAAHGVPAVGRSGLAVWVPVADEPAVTGALLERGWAVAPGERFRIASPAGDQDRHRHADPPGSGQAGGRHRRLALAQAAPERLSRLSRQRRGRAGPPVFRWAGPVLLPGGWVRRRRPCARSRARAPAPAPHGRR